MSVIAVEKKFYTTDFFGKQNVKLFYHNWHLLENNQKIYLYKMQNRVLKTFRRGVMTFSTNTSIRLTFNLSLYKLTAEKHETPFF